MASFGLTGKGLRRKRYVDVLNTMEDRAKELFGENINLSERSPLGLFIRLISWSIGIVWQVVEDVYNSAFVDTAEGHSLDKVALYIGITRRPATRATGTVKFTGDDNTVIDEGFLLETEDGVQFETTEEATIETGTAEAGIRALEPGTDSNVPASTITEIVNPIEGLDSATNEAATEGGLNKETDAELRQRYIDSVAKGGASTIDSIKASLLDLDAVRAALVIENHTMDIVDGRPPKSFESYVLALDNPETKEKVAHTILEVKAAGIKAYGTESETVIDDAGQEHTIGFTFANEVNIEINVTKTTNEEYPEDGDERMVTEIIRYIGGTDEDGSIYAGLSMGEDVIFTQIIKACYRVPGLDDVDVTINKVGEAAGTDNISIALTEVAETDYEKVSVS